jgi:hypothetical protein
VVTIITKCAWCGKLIKRRIGNSSKNISHGICPDCKQRVISSCRFSKSNENLRERIEPGKKILSLADQERLQDELLILEQAGLEQDIEKLFKQVRLLENKHMRIVFIRAARQVISQLI